MQVSVQVRAVAFGPDFTEMVRCTLAWLILVPDAELPAPACTLPHAATTAAQATAARVDRTRVAVRSRLMFMPVGRGRGPAGSGPIAKPGSAAEKPGTLGSAPWITPAQARPARPATSRIPTWNP